MWHLCATPSLTAYKAADNTWLWVVFLRQSRSNILPCCSIVDHTHCPATSCKHSAQTPTPQPDKPGLPTKCAPPTPPPPRPPHPSILTPPPHPPRPCPASDPQAPPYLCCVSPCLLYLLLQLSRHFVLLCQPVLLQLDVSQQGQHRQTLNSRQLGTKHLVFFGGGGRRGQ